MSDQTEQQTSAGEAHERKRFESSAGNAPERNQQTSAGTSPAGAAGEISNGTAGRKSKRKWPGILAVAAVLILAICAAALLLPGVTARTKALLSLTGLLEEEYVGLAPDVTVEIDGQSYEIEGEIWIPTELITSGDESGEQAEGETSDESGDGAAAMPLTVITVDELSVYYAEGVVFMSDGTAYRLTEGAADSSEVQTVSALSILSEYGTLLSLLKTWYADTTISVASEGDQTVYSIALDAESGQEMLALLYAPAAELVSEMGELTVDLYAEDGTASAIVISGSAPIVSDIVSDNNDLAGSSGGVSADDSGEAAADGSTDNSGGTGSVHTLTLNAHIDILDPALAPEIPEAVSAAVQAGGWEDAPVLTDALLQVLAAWNTLSGSDRFGADIILSADLGLITLSQGLQWVRTTEGEEPVNRVTVFGLDFYYTDSEFAEAVSGGDSASDTDGTEADEDALRLTLLFDTALEAFLRGGVTIAAEGDTAVYTVTLEPDQMESVITTLVPDAADLGITWQEGCFTATVTEDTFTEVAFTGGGSIPVLFTEVEVGLTVTADIMTQDELDAVIFPETMDGAETQ